MRKLFTFLAVGTLLFSCSDEAPIGDSSNSAKISVVEVSGNTILPGSRANQDQDNLALSFADEESLKEFESSLESMTQKERLETVEAYGIKNLYKLAQQADDELEQIGAKASSENEFRQLYAQYVNKYKGYLVQNTLDDTDLTLYVPNKNNIGTYICNSKGVYVVAGEIRTFAIDYESVATQLGVSTLKTEEIIKPNEITVIPASGKLLRFIISRKYDTVHIYNRFQKKMWYGWKNDTHHEIMWDYHLKGVNMEWINISMPRYLIKTDKGEFEEDILRITSSGKLTGEVWVWTDYQYERDANNNIIIENIQGINFPKCLESKAYKIQVNL